MNPDELIRRVAGRVEAVLRNAPGCHDYDHTLRVVRNARFVAEKELSADDELLHAKVMLAAFLHDIARPEEMESKGKICHAQLGGPKAEKILREEGCTDETMIREISGCIRRHRYRGKEKPLTLLDRIVYDADKLDSIGAVGVGRAFHFAGRSGARLHNHASEALASEEYSREDSAYREYLVKLRHVPERMLTESGKRLAEERTEFMHEFFRRLCSESGVE